MEEDSSIGSENVEEQLAHATRELELAAKFGKNLLDENADIKDQLNRKEAELSQLLENIQELEATNRALESQKKDDVFTPSREDGEDDGTADEAERVRALADRQKILTEQLSEAESTNRALLADISERDEKISRLKSTEKELPQLRDRISELQDKLDGATVEIQQLRSQKDELLKANVAMKQEHRKHRDRSMSMEKKMHRLEGQLSTTDAPQKQQIADMRKKLEEAYTQLDEMEQTLSDLRWEKKKTEEAVASLARENQQLYKEQQEHLSFLDDARSTVSSLKQTLEEQQLMVQATPKTDAPPTSSSILGELEKELLKKLGDNKPAPRKESQSDATMAMPADPKDCEEYFFLAATAVKISMAIKTPQTSDGVFRINLHSLYQQALDSNVPFHEWYDWIREQLKRKRAALDRSSVSDVNNPVNRVDKPGPIAYPGGVVNPGPAAKQPPKKSGWSLFGK